ncbi:putative autotransporter adhesin-like protein [Roseivirga pacifica]|uniref:Putative auto-transporter adhesin, head GIN domain n=1 Tax=Roseivirga pacifica TaxID=1267423 RepID=A0A1I0Q5T8_9BACT|nr:head GIN domain-containing protein [Roseivirga pacifica]RKQ43222.1 putative autotransporter adhesin-like protein [Roseivirga pacifica]SEW22229.1 Putative auto-transporter adhesin, head GIN domain [Roseivirga pacifica]
MKKQTLLLIALFTLSISSCDLDGISPSGPVVTETYTLGDFEKVNIGLPAKVTLVQVTENPEVVIEAHENLFNVIKVNIHGNELKLGTRSNINSSGIINITIYTTALSSLSFTGSGSLQTENCFEAEELKVVLSGSGDLSLCGTFSNLEVYATGSGNLNANEVSAGSINATITGSSDIQFNGTSDMLDVAISGSGSFSGFGLTSKEVNATLTGSGNISAYAETKLTVRLTGSGDISYKGNPQVNTRVTGSGKIIKTN